MDYMMHFDIKITENVSKRLLNSQHLLIWLFADSDQIDGVSPISPVGFLITSHASPRDFPVGSPIGFHFRFYRIYLRNCMRLLVLPKHGNIFHLSISFFRAFNCNKYSLLKKSLLLFLLSEHSKVDYSELVSNIALALHKPLFFSSTFLSKITIFDTVQRKVPGFRVQKSNFTE